MKMVLHILLKDLRRHWREIALFVLVCAVWTWQTSHPDSFVWMHEREIIPMLMFGLWFFIAVRVVQGESLVGDREFWPTRPYRWGQLMVAKALFLVLCLNLPLMIAGVVLVAHAGIPLSLSLVPGFLFLQLEFAIMLTFPALALASITESLVQWLLAVAGLIVFTIVVSWLPWSALPPPLPGGTTLAMLLGGGVIAALLAFALVWQYARRRAWPARLAVAAAVLAVPLTILIAPTTFIRSIAYPPAMETMPVKLSIVEPAAGGQREYDRVDQGPYYGVITIPVVVAPTGPDTAIYVDAVRVTLTGDNGWKWQSDWLLQPLQLNGDHTRGWLAVTLPNEDANQAASTHAKASMEVFFNVYRLGPERRIDTSPDHFSIPGAGYCQWSPMEFHSKEPTSRLDCDAPFRQAGILVTRQESGESTCTAPKGEPPLPAGHTATGVIYGLNQLPVDFDPNPAHGFELDVNVWDPPIPNTLDPKTGRSAWPCQGTPVTVRVGALAHRYSATFNLGDLGTEKRVNPTELTAARFNLTAE